MKRQYLTIWADNSIDSQKLIEYLKEYFEVNHILTASPEPIARSNGDLIVGLSNIYSFFVATQSNSPCLEEAS
ncbi:MAG: hypothetical protein ACOCU3_01885 [bacterium]